MGEKRFPVGGFAKDSVPWSLVEPFRDQAMKNHDQTLERLAERGGLSWMEMFAIATGSSGQDIRDWRKSRD